MTETNNEAIKEEEVRSNQTKVSDQSLIDLSTRSNYLLEFHGQMIRDVCGWDENKIDLEHGGLLITGSGLGISRLLVFIMEVYSREPGLVFLLNVNVQEMEFLKEWIRDVSITMNPGANLDRIFTISAEIPRQERIKIYEKGGVVSITSRILIVDMLDDSVSVPKISGIIVNHSERVIDSSVEKFILRLYSDRNKKGFIRAFSDEASSFTSGLLQLEKAMKSLQLRRVYLWPRFHVEVGLALNKGKVDLTEVRVHVSKPVREIQEALIECVEQSLGELRRLNPMIYLDDIKMEGALFPDFDNHVRMRLSPFMHKISSKTKKIVADLRLLRRLLVYLLSFDCVSFYTFLKTVIAADLRVCSEEDEDTSTAPPHSWLMLNAAQSVLTLSRDRVYKKVNNRTVPVLEEQPKWKALRKIMALIRKDREKKIAQNKDPGSVLIAAEGLKTCHQIASILCDTSSPPSFLSTLLNDHFALESALNSIPTPAKQSTVNEQSFKRRRVRQNQGNNSETYEDMQPCPEDIATPALGHTLDPEKNQVFSFSVSKISITKDENYLYIWPYYCGSSEHSASGLDGDRDARILDNLKPQYIVMYDPNLGFVRRIEIYRSLSSENIPLTIYSLVYDSSIEEQRYLSQIRKEHSALEKLIKDSATIAIPVNPQPLKRVPRPSETFLWDALDSRDISTQLDATDIVVDVREFRSPLPFALYEQGARLLPCTLEVGDYILSPQIAVERKSVGDLLQSLSSGRLYSQVNAMCLHYSIPVLLIEWGKNHPFNLKYDHHTRGEVTSKEIYSKLIIVCITFPKLRVLWSSSPDASAEMLLDLKKNQDEPNITAAIETGIDGLQKVATNFAITPVDILKSLPSITIRNYRYVISKVSSLKTLVEKNREWFEELLGKIPGFKLWSFINNRVGSEIQTETSLGFDFF